MCRVVELHTVHQRVDRLERRRVHLDISAMPVTDTFAEAGGVRYSGRRRHDLSRVENVVAQVDVDVRTRQLESALEHAAAVSGRPQEWTRRVKREVDHRSI